MLTAAPAHAKCLENETVRARTSIQLESLGMLSQGAFPARNGEKGEGFQPEGGLVGRDLLAGDEGEALGVIWRLPFSVGWVCGLPQGDYFNGHVGHVLCSFSISCGSKQCPK